MPSCEMTEDLQTPITKVVSDWMKLLEKPCVRERTTSDIRVVLYTGNPFSSYLCRHSSHNRLPRGKCRNTKPISDTTYVGCSMVKHSNIEGIDDLISNVTFEYKETN